MEHTKIKVGDLTIVDPEQVDISYECVAWYKTFRVDPGTYPVYAYLTWTNIKERYVGHTLYASCEGEVTAASFRNRIGAFYGTDRGSELVGRKEDTAIQIGFSQIQDRVDSGELVLDEELIVSEVLVGNSGKPRVYWRLTDNFSEVRKARE